MASDEIGSFSYVRVPPDSTGKRTSSRRIYAIDYVAGVVQFVKGQFVEGLSSGAIASVLRVSGTVAAGTIYVQVEEDSPVTEFTSGEKLLVENVEYATISAITAIYTQTNVNVGFSNPLNGQNVSGLGAAHVRFTEGDQLIDAFGSSKVSQSDLVDQITFQYNSNTLRFYDNVTGSGAAITHLTNSNSIALDIGTSSGELVQRTTHVYYPYQPGFGALTEMTVLSGDSGKDGVIRRWGRFDDNDGVYFELSGSSLSVCIRSSTSGTPVVTKVSQSSWNVDSYDGTGVSSLELAVDKLNLYWIDYAWLGAGQVRFGIYSGDGTRHVLHRFENAGASVVPYMKRGNLPFRLEISNSQGTASPSRLTLTCAAIKNDGIRITPDSKFGVQWSYNTDEAFSVTSTGWTPLITWRGTLNIGSIRNHLLSIPSSFAGYSDLPVALKLYNFSVLATGSWTQWSTSGLEFASSASLLGGNAVNSWYVEASSSYKYEITEHNEFNSIATSKAQGIPGNIWVLAAKSLIPGLTASVFSRMTWTDIE